MHLSYVPDGLNLIITVNRRRFCGLTCPRTSLQRLLAGRVSAELAVCYYPGRRLIQSLPIGGHYESHPAKCPDWCWCPDRLADRGALSDSSEPVSPDHRRESFGCAGSQSAGGRPESVFAWRCALRQGSFRRRRSEVQSFAVPHGEIAERRRGNHASDFLEAAQCHRHRHRRATDDVAEEPRRRVELLDHWEFIRKRRTGGPAAGETGKRAERVVLYAGYLGQETGTQGRKNHSWEHQFAAADHVRSRECHRFGLFPELQISGDRCRRPSWRRHS